MQKRTRLNSYLDLEAIHARNKDEDEDEEDYDFSTYIAPLSSCYCLMISVVDNEIVSLHETSEPSSALHSDTGGAELRSLAASYVQRSKQLHSTLKHDLHETDQDIFARAFKFVSSSSIFKFRLSVRPSCFCITRLHEADN